MKPRRSGFTIVELLVVVSIIALLIAILLPAIGKARDAARMTQSQGNLRNLSVACDTYAADWGDRQWTAVPDDAGLVGGDGVEYGNVVGCMGQMFAGYDSGGSLWAFWCGGDLCGANSGYPGNAGYWSNCFDNFFSPHGLSPNYANFGAFRLCTAKAFNSYVGDRWYDKVFFAPKDVIPFRLAEPFFDYPGEFTPNNPQNASDQTVAYSSYVFSPAAMWNPDVTATCGFSNPKGGAPAAYKSPAVGLCKFPDLKTRMIEHHWLQNSESESNPLFSGDDPSWLFSQGYNSAPVCMFFDGSVRTKGVREAMDADQRAAKLVDENNICDGCDTEGRDGPPEAGLWNRSYMSAFNHASGESSCNSPLSTTGGYGFDRAYDSIVSTGMHIGTTNGIRGRDFIAVSE